MIYQYNGFIHQNVAPNGAKKIGVYNASGKRICEIPLGNLSMPDVGTKLYSYGLLSDLHLSGNSAEGTRLDNAMTYFEEQGCSFCCHAGDMTNIGFWYNSTDTEIYFNQMAEYKGVREKHPNLPLYGICGNHENYNKSITENLTELKEYTGQDLYYTVTQGNDVFIFVSQPVGNRPMNNEQLQWLYETLEANRNKRCFVFVHPFVADSDSGNPYGVYSNKIFDWWGENTTAFKNLMKHYKNVIVCHGHSHMHFDMQLEIKNAIYSEVLGFRSIHIPSTSWNRKIVNGESVNVGGCYGYLVDVYENYIVLNGLDLSTNQVVPIATYCINTTIQTIKEDTFVDSTGIIKI